MVIPAYIVYYLLEKENWLPVEAFSFQIKGEVSGSLGHSPFHLACIWSRPLHSTL